MVGLAQVKFLLIDDNVHMLDVVETILRGFGARRIVRAATSEAALAHLRNGIDIVITDYMIGGLDVIAFTKGIRQKPGVHDRFVPIILLTAHSSRPRIEAARDAGVTEICVKPVTPRDLFRRLVAVIDYPRPFVMSPSYTGPCRRRRVDAAYDGPERRAGAMAATTAA
jgi:CheY-like chemotaxis protein